MDKALKVSAENPTSTEASAAIGAIIEAQAGRYDRLRLAQALTKNPERKQDLDLDEISDLVGEEVIDAGVRGSGDDVSRMKVIYLFEGPDGRTDKGICDYADLPKSITAYEDRKDLELDASRAARSAGGSEEVFGEDPRVSRLTEEVDKLRAALKEKGDQDALPPEPLSGYQDLSVQAIEDAISRVEDPVSREIVKRDVRAYEAAWKGEEKVRKGVLSATEPVALVEAPPAE